MSPPERDGLREAIVTVPDTRWEDIGGLDAVKRRLREVVEEPLLNPESFSAMKLRPPMGILLYGPPGTGKIAEPRSRRSARRQNSSPCAGSASA